MTANDFLKVGQTYIYMYLAPYKLYCDDSLPPLSLVIEGKEEFEATSLHPKGVSIIMRFKELDIIHKIDVYDNRTHPTYVSLGYDEKVLVIMPDKAEAKKILMNKAYKYEKFTQATVDREALYHNVKTILEYLKKAKI